ncbi:tRNA(Met) cytidine acetyltransferase TmcA [Halorhabdus sp. CUG00001]|uniref:tRNA(Met) cytidine acetyltransferase TmcA n=1 Tax=Halorhabdus sp. CUG00001 TaxID=2600297 RepID=UPI00131E735C|nr:tRNA(Met) cytidine acetyltransferase TmcA [Halorhabdus sp. CUG00001]
MGHSIGRRLRAEAQRTDERRLVVLAGESGTREPALRDVVADARLDSETLSVVSQASLLGCERIDPTHSDKLLGQTRDGVVYDATERFDPDVLAHVVGAIAGGGLGILLTPPLDTWPDRRDRFDSTLAVPPFGVGDVTGHFRRRIVATLRSHPGIAIVDTDTETIESDGLRDPAPRLRTAEPSTPDDHAFPAAVYRRCRTADQVEAVAAFETLLAAGRAVVVEADRGRGKSSAAGFAAGSLAAAGRDVLVTAPERRNATELFDRARELRADLDAGGDGGDQSEAPSDGGSEDSRLPIEFDAGSIRYERPDVAVEQASDADVVFVDEAAALPVAVLDGLLDARSVGFTSTVRGYEGTGRGFDVRFRDRLAESDFDVTEQHMDDPIRYAAGDPIETWLFRALLLDATPAPAQLVTDATPENVAYRQLESTTLLENEPLLGEVFGLLVVAHYRTEPADFARLLDAPNVSVRALTLDGHVVSVALLAREGALPADIRGEMYEGGRVAGNMIPDVLTSQLRDEAAAVPSGQRVMRIATHDAVRGRGLGSRLLSAIHDEFAETVDWLGTGYGATPELVDFWRENGYSTVHLSTSRNERSGEHSAIMLRPTSPDGEELLDRHTGWLLDRIEGTLSAPLSALDPDVVRAVLRSIDRPPELDLSAFEWRVLAGSPHGAGLYDTAPAAFARLALRHLVEPAGESLLSARQERLLVTKTLQHRPWETVTDALNYHSRRECMRTLGAAVGTLIEAYGTDNARREFDRFE